MCLNSLYKKCQSSLLLMVLLMGLSVISHAQTSSSVSECQPHNDMEFFCGFKNPEDMVHVPGTKQLIVSQLGTNPANLGGSLAKPGSLVAFDTESKQITALYPLENSHKPKTPLPLWGEDSCVKPPAHFSPLGIDITERADGKTMLLVTNRIRQADGFSVQLFEVLSSNDSLRLQWRGCVEAPAPYVVFGEVAALPNDGFVIPIYQLIAEKAAKSSMYEGLNMHRKSCDVLSWRKDTGFTTAVSMKNGMFNGISASKDGKFVYVNQMKPLGDGGGVFKIELDLGQVYAMAELPMPDNSSWGEDGNLLIASPNVSVRPNLSIAETLELAKKGIIACVRDKAAVCHDPFDIYSINPETMEKELIYAHNGEAMGHVTVALQVDGYIYFGASNGNRIARIKYPE